MIFPADTFTFLCIRFAFRLLFDLNDWMEHYYYLEERRVSERREEEK